MILTDQSNADYHADKTAISSTDVKTVAKQSLFHWANAQRKTSSAFDQGSAVHAMLLEPEKELVVKGPKDRRGNAWKDLYAECEAKGQTLLPEGEYYEAEAMAQAAMFTPAVADMLTAKDLIAEASFFSECPDTGVKLKCRPDGLVRSRNLIFDIKTTTDASPYGFAKHVNSFGYDLQAAFYLRALRAAGEDVRNFAFIAIEKTFPYCVQIHVLSPSYIEHADNRVIETLRKIQNAQETQTFGTGWPTVNEIHPPKWFVDGE